MSLTEEEANKLWLEMFEQNKIKMGILFATELYQPLNIKEKLDKAKVEFYQAMKQGDPVNPFEDAYSALADCVKKWFGDK